MGRFARGRPAGRGARLRKVWCAGTPFDRATMGVTQSVISSCAIAEAGALEGTVLRTRGEVLVTGDPNATTDSDLLALGICIVTDNALAVGGASVPGPLNDDGADYWLWHRYVPMDSAGETAVRADSISSIVRVEIDSKAMRRVGQDSAVVLIGELLSGDYASIIVSGGIRFLLGV